MLSPFAFNMGNSMSYFPCFHTNNYSASPYSSFADTLFGNSDNTVDNTYTDSPFVDSGFSSAFNSSSDLFQTLLQLLQQASTGQQDDYTDTTAINACIVDSTSIDTAENCVITEDCPPETIPVVCPPEDTTIPCPPVTTTPCPPEDTTPVTPGTPTTPTTPGTPTTPSTPNRVWGDPHVVYQDEQGKTHKYDFQGKQNQWFNAIKDGNFTFNAYFSKWDKHGTVMTKLGMDINGHKITADMKGQPTLDGQEIKAGQTYTFDSGIAGKDGKNLQASVFIDPKGNLNVNSGEYNLKIGKSTKYFNVSTGVTSVGSYANGKTPDGFMGPIFDPNYVNFGKDGKQGHKAQGQGFLDKGPEAYQVSDQFGQPQYANTKDVAVKWGVLAGNATATAN